MKVLGGRLAAACGLLVVLVLAVDGPAPAGQAGALSGPSGSAAQVSPHDQSCGDPVGSTDWSGTFTVTINGATMVRAFSGTVIFDSDGTIVDGSAILGIPLFGFVDCGSLSITDAGGSASGALSYSGTTITGSGVYVYEGYSGSWSGSAMAEPDLTLAPSILPDSPGPVDYTVTLSGSGAAPTGPVDVSDDQGSTCSIDSFVSGVGSCALDEEASGGPYTVTASYGGDANYATASTTVTNTAAVATGGTITTGSQQIAATAQGGTAGVDTISEAQYGTSPVGNLTDGANYFDVAASTGNTFSSVVVQDCNNVTESSILDWWDPTANDGAGGWSPVVGDPGPSFDPGPPACLSATLDTTTVPTISQLTGTVFASAPTRAITSAGATSALSGTPFSLTVTTAGSPTPSVTESGPLPAGLHFVDDGDGTATLAGTPTGATVGGIYKPTFTATYGSGGTLGTVEQTLTLFVYAAPVFSSAASASAKVGTHLNFVVTAHGYTPPVVTETGALPHGVTFTTKYNGTAVLSGTPAAGTGGRSYPVTFAARNNVGTPIVQHFTLVVAGLRVSTVAIPAGKRGKAYSTTLAATGGVKPLVWKALSALPKGLHLSSAGKITGTPSLTLAAKTYAISVEVTDSTKPTRLTAKATLSLKLS